MDSVLVALFAARHHQFFEETLVQRELTEAVCARNRQGIVAPLRWRQALQHALRYEVRLLTEPRDSGHVCNVFRQMLAAVPLRTSSAATGDEVIINFAAAQQQSAVDFLHYLFDVLCAQDEFATVQHSTTFMKRRAELVDAPLSKLAVQWKLHPVVKRFTADNAAELEDPSERAALEQDKSGKACIVENAAGDRRRISAPESAPLVSCHLTTADTDVVDITRELQPQAEYMDDIDGYTGPIFVKMIACRVTKAPVLIFDVSRKVDGLQKLETPVNYGMVEEGNIVLDLHGVNYKLNAVVCHVGSATDGHYVAFVCGETGHWFFYDDAHRGGQMLRLPKGVHDLERMGAASPSISGELFFYDLL